MSTRGPRLVLLGKQGAGKGTQASRIADALRRRAPLDRRSVPRAAAAQGTRARPRGQGLHGPRRPRARRDRRRRRRGAASADDYRIRRGFVLDGFPRTRRQAEELHRILDGHPLDLAIDLDVPTEIVLASPDRGSRRRVRSDVRRPAYHVERSHPPAGDWKCDVCGGQVVQRDDDTEEAVMRRLELYEIETLPVIQFYRARGALVARRRKRRERRGVQEARGDRRVAPRSREAVITRKTPEQIALMRKAGKVVAEMHEVLHAGRQAGRDDARRRPRRPRGHRAARRPLQLPQLPRLPGGGVHVAQRGHRARHPERGRRPRGGRHPLHRLRGDHRGLARRRRDHRARSARSTTSRSASSRSPGARLEDAIEQIVAGNRLGDVGAAVEGIARSRPGSRSCGSTSATGSAPPCTRSRRSPTTGRPGGA